MIKFCYLVGMNEFLESMKTWGAPQELANYLGLSSRHVVYQWIKKKSIPKQYIQKVAAYCGTTVEELLR